MVNGYDRVKWSACTQGGGSEGTREGEEEDEEDDERFRPCMRVYIDKQTGRTDPESHTGEVSSPALVTGNLKDRIHKRMFASSTLAPDSLSTPKQLKLTPAAL